MSTQGVANYTASAKVAAEMEKSTDGLIDQEQAWKWRPNTGWDVYKNMKMQ